jgi:hypothetical protein
VWHVVGPQAPPIILRMEVLERVVVRVTVRPGAWTSPEGTVDAARREELAALHAKIASLEAELETHRQKSAEVCRSITYHARVAIWR